MTEVTDDAVHTMIMLDMEVRKKIREEIISMVKTPRDDDEKAFAAELIRHAQAARDEQLMRAQREMQQQMVEARQAALENYQSSFEQKRLSYPSGTDNSGYTGGMLGGIFGTKFPF